MVAACEDDCTRALSDKAKDWFKCMGSKEIEKVDFRCGYAFIGGISISPPD